MFISYFFTILIMLLFVYNNHNVFIFFSGLGIRSFTLRSSFFRSKLICLKKDGKLFALLTQVNQSKKSDMSISLVIPSFALKKRAIRWKEFYSFHSFFPFYAQERRKRFALVSLYKRASVSESLLSIFTKERP